MTKVKQLSKMIGTLALATMFVVFGMFAFAGCEKKTTAKEIQDFVSAESTNNSFAIDTSAEGFAGAGVAVTSSFDGGEYGKVEVTYKTYTDKDGNVTSVYVCKKSATEYAEEENVEIYVKDKKAYTKNSENKYVVSEVADADIDLSIVNAYIGDLEESITMAISAMKELDSVKYTYSKSGKNTTYKLSAENLGEYTIVYNGNTINKFSCNSSLGVNVTVERLTSAPSVPTFNSDNTVE